MGTKQTYPEALRALNKAVYDTLRADGAPISRDDEDRQFLLELAAKTDRMVDAIGVVSRDLSFKGEAA